MISATKRFSLILMLILSLPLWADEELGGYASERLESEAKLVVPTSIKENFWKFLSNKFIQSSNLQSIHPKMTAELSVEYFKDTYFDSADLKILSMENGLRKRERLIPDNPTHPKHGRTLIQLKLKGKDNSYRYEVKYPLESKKSLSLENISVEVSAQYREDFLRRLRVLGVDAAELVPTLVIQQKRSRVYLKIDNRPFMTITFDETDSSFLFWKEKIDEVEIELNEIAFTEASEQRRNAMLAVSENVKRTLLSAFPELKQDQTPKYNKMMTQIAEKNKLMNFTMKWSRKIRGFFQ